MTEKLVRDRIPSVMLNKGETVTYRKALPQERVKLLWDKLHEELEELFQAVTDDEKVEEMADVIEVLRALAARLTTAATLDRVMNTKADQKGVFDLGYVMEL